MRPRALQVAENTNRVFAQLDPAKGNVFAGLAAWTTWVRGMFWGERRECMIRPEGMAPALPIQFCMSGFSRR